MQQNSKPTAQEKIIDRQLKILISFHIFIYSEGHWCNYSEKQKDIEDMIIQQKLIAGWICKITQNVR